MSASRWTGDKDQARLLLRLLSSYTAAARIIGDLRPILEQFDVLNAAGDVFPERVGALMRAARVEAPLEAPLEEVSRTLQLHPRVGERPTGDG